MYDLGLGDGALRWIVERSHITVRSIPDTPLVQAIRLACGDRTMAKPKAGGSSICPELILDAPYRRVAWIDADAIVLGIEPLFDLMVTTGGDTETSPWQTANLSSFCTIFPCPLWHKLPEILLNAGGSGWCLDRDRACWRLYAPDPVYFRGQSLPRETVRWHDQGCLIWALQNAGILHPSRSSMNLCVSTVPSAAFSLLIRMQVIQS